MLKYQAASFSGKIGRKGFLMRFSGKKEGREALLYIVTGVFTTLVNFFVFSLLDFGLARIGVTGKLSYKFAYAAAFLAAVIFAYWSNKLYVFQNKDMSLPRLLREFSAFLAARLFSGAVCFLLMILLVDIMELGHSLAWALSSVFNLGFNYLASKFWIFREKMHE